MQDYYYRPPGPWRKLRCAGRLIPLIVGLGHDFELQYTERKEPMQWGGRTIDTPCGEIAGVCRLCFRVENRRNWQGFRPEISYGSSPSMGRRLEHRKVDHLPIAPDGQEPTCGASMPVGMYEATGSHTLVSCRKFLWHTWSPDQSMRTHSGSRPGPSGHQTFMWDDEED